MSGEKVEKVEKGAWMVVFSNLGFLSWPESQWEQSISVGLGGTLAHADDPGRCFRVPFGSSPTKLTIPECSPHVITAFGSFFGVCRKRCADRVQPFGYFLRSFHNRARFHFQGWSVGLNQARNGPSVPPNNKRSPMEGARGFSDPPNPSWFVPSVTRHIHHSQSGIFANGESAAPGVRNPRQGP